MTVLIIEDLVSRKWLTHLVSVEEPHTQVENAFMAALETEGLLQAALDRAGTGRADPDVDDGLTPILLAVSDNGSQMIARDTRPVHDHARHRPTLRPPLDPDRPGLDRVPQRHRQGRMAPPAGDHRPGHPAAELERVRTEYNTVRLHSGIGYVTPHDEHTGRGQAIRAARRQGLHDARTRRLAHHRQHRDN